MRAANVGVMLWLVAMVGCRRGAEPRKVGGDLPVTSSTSVALPGATDAADAPRAPSVLESQRADLTLYRDPATGVSFRYPTVWRPAQGGVVPAPAFSAVAGSPRITQEFSPQGNVYAPTVLRGLTFSYTVQTNSDRDACAAVPRRAVQSSADRGDVIYGGNNFAEASGSDAGACTRVESRVDSTLRDRECLVFERDFITSCPYVTSQTLPRPLTQAETAALHRHLDDIMQSVQIAPR